jgi:hypothetical protein
MTLDRYSHVLPGMGFLLQKAAFGAEEKEFEPAIPYMDVE